MSQVDRVAEGSQVSSGSNAPFQEVISRKSLCGRGRGHVRGRGLLRGMGKTILDHNSQSMMAEVEPTQPNLIKPNLYGPLS